MTHLSPCPACQRHVRVSEPSCPFCGVTLELGATPAPVLPKTRLGRAATFAFGATLAGMTTWRRAAATPMTVTAGAPGRPESRAAGGAAGMGGKAGSGGDGGGVQPVYGAPVDTGGTSGSGGEPASGGSGGMSSGGARHEHGRGRRRCAASLWRRAGGRRLQHLRRRALSGSSCASARYFVPNSRSPASPRPGTM